VLKRQEKEEIIFNYMENIFDCVKEHLVKKVIKWIEILSILKTRIEKHFTDMTQEI
jgi:hypothetical protein